MERKALIFSIDGRDDLVKEIVTLHNNVFMSKFDSDRKTPVAMFEGGVCVRHFADGEVSVDFETSIRGHVVYLLCSPNSPDKIMALNMAIDAAKRAAAVEIIPIIPYFPYARQDKKDYIRGAIGAKVLAEMIEYRGATSVITFDLHADQIQGFFNIPVTHMEGKYLFDGPLSVMYGENTDVVLCSPDAGGVKRVKQFRDRMRNLGMDMPYVTIDKTREEANVVGSMEVIGDVKDKYVVIIDDMVDTAGTLVKAAYALKKAGATGVSAIATHGVLSGPAYERLYNATEDGGLDLFICSNSLEIDDYVTVIPKQVRIDGFIDQQSIAEQVVRAIYANNNHESVEALKNE